MEMKEDSMFYSMTVTRIILKKLKRRTKDILIVLYNIIVGY